MNIQKKLGVSLGVLSVTFSLLAQNEKLQMSLQANCKELNGQGNVVKRNMNTRTLLNNCAEDNALTGTNRPPLVLVYNVGSGNPRLDTIEVVNRTNGTVLCTIASITGGVAITNGSGTQIERHAFVYQGVNLAEQIGSAVISEKFPGGDVSKHKIQGKIQFGLPPSGDSSGEICSGNFSTSKPFVTP